MKRTEIDLKQFFDAGNVSRDNIPDFTEAARAMKSMYDTFIDVGFTNEQALLIVINFFGKGV